MGFRFRKSITLLPWLRINLGPNGLSLSIGRKGASMNAGADGIYANVGIPGSGVSYRKKLLGGLKDPSSNASSVTDDPYHQCQDNNKKAN